MKRRWGWLVAIALVGSCVVGGGRAWGYLRLESALSAVRQLVLSPHPEASLESIESLRKSYPENAEVCYLSAVAHRRLGQTTAAREDLGRAAKLGWNRQDLLRQKYLIDFQSGQVKESEPHLRELLADRCSDEVASEIYECFAKGYLSDVRLREATLSVDYWLQWQPNSVQAHVLKAEILDGARDKPGLLQEYNEILRLDPDDKLTSMRLGFLLLEGKDVRGAKQQFDAHVERWPDDAIARVGRASCQRQLGDVAAAEVEFKRALEGELPDNQRGFALAELGQLALAQKQYQQARDFFERSLETSPRNSTTHYSLAMLLSRDGEKAAAEQHLEKSRILEDQAVRLDALLNEVIDHPADPDLRCQAGEILLEQGNLKEAFIWLLSALRCERWHAPTHRALARYYVEVDKPDLASQHLEWANNPQVTEGGPAEAH